MEVYPSASGCAPWISCLQDVSHTCSGVQLCKRSSHRFQGEKWCFPEVTKHTSRSVLPLVGDRYIAQVQPPLCETECRRMHWNPSPSPPHAWLSYDAAEKIKRKKKKKNSVFNLSNLVQVSAQTKVKQACSKPLRHRIYIVITVMETDLYNFYTA